MEAGLGMTEILMAGCRMKIFPRERDLCLVGRRDAGCGIGKIDDGMQCGKTESHKLRTSRGELQF